MNPETPHSWNHKHASAEELAALRSFQAWVDGRDRQACAYWDDWQLAHPERSSIIEEAAALVRQLKFREYSYKPEMDAVEAQLRQLNSERHRARILRLCGAAAAAAVILVAGGWWLLRSPSRIAPAIAKQTKHRVKPGTTTANTDAWQTQTNLGTAPMEMRLADGSVATLFPKSTISYPGSFSAERRAVRISGDARFDVAKETGRPFTVYSRQLTVAVLGTSFRIIASEKKSTVKLFSGKVRVLRTADVDGTHDVNTGIVLSPGEQLVFDGSLLAVSKFHQNDDGPLYTNFHNAPLGEVLKTLSSLYQIAIDYKPDDVTGCRFTGNIDKNDQADAVLSAIARLNGLIVIRTDKGFSINRSTH